MRTDVKNGKIVDCAEFKQSFPLVLDNSFNKDSEWGQQISDHVFDCEACNEWADIGCDRYVQKMRSVLEGMKPSKVLIERMDEHHNECESCYDQNIIITCEQFKQFGGMDHKQICDNFGEMFSSLRDILSEHRDTCQSCDDWALTQKLIADQIDLSQYPCVHIINFVIHDCDQHEDAFSCPDTLLVDLGEGKFGLPIRATAASLIF